MSCFSPLHPLLEDIVSWLGSEVQCLYRRHAAINNGVMELKTDGTFVGELDKAIAQSCRDALGHCATVVTEEDKEVTWPPEANAPATLLLDPLDGTHNHGMGWPSYGTQGVLVERGALNVSFVFRPVIEQLNSRGLYLAVRSKGAYQYDSLSKTLTRLQVATESDLAKAFVLFEGSSRKQDASAEVRQVKRLAGHHRINISCAESGALVAHGNLYPLPAHALIAVDNAPWDNLPPLLLIKEAGGKVTDFQGNFWTLRSRNLVAANPNLHAAILAAMRNPKE